MNRKKRQGRSLFYIKNLTRRSQAARVGRKNLAVTPQIIIMLAAI